jgi:phage tail tape-measure protein
MATIIAGRVETQQRAADLMAQLQSIGIAASDMQAFYVNPPGQHATYPIGGDMDADTGTEESSLGQASGIAVGAAAGLAAGAVAGAAIPPLAPIIAVAMAGVGAHVGGMAGALASTRPAHEEKQHTETKTPDTDAVDMRRGGMMLAVRVDPANEKSVIDLLTAAVVEDLERAKGDWQEGQWIDFDPLAPPHKIGVENRRQ